MDHISECESQGQRYEEGFTSGKGAWFGGTFGAAVEHFDWKTGFAARTPFVRAEAQFIDTAVDVFEQFVGTVEHVAETFGHSEGDERHFLPRRRVLICGGE